MLKNYLKIAWRNLLKHKVFSVINIAGLAIGMSACILIMLFVYYEQSFDNFQKKNIYRLSEIQKYPGMAAPQKVALSQYPMGPTMKNEFPQIKEFAHVKWSNKYELTNKESRVFVPQVFFTEPSFFRIFDFKLIKGNAHHLVDKPNTAVITQSTAKKLFGDQDPIGKTITHYGGDTTSYAITGVLADVPQNSQLQFDAVFSLSSIMQPWMEKWGSNWLNTYLELAPGTNAAALEKRLPVYLKKYMSDHGNPDYYELLLLPFKDIHGKTQDVGLDYLNYQKFDSASVKLFAFIGLIVLIIAAVNFMNLSTAKSAERAKEVGVRKSVGAQRYQLSFQFLSETVLLAFIALAFALIIVFVALPYVNNLCGRQIGGPLYHNIGFMVGILVATVLVGLVAGIYPSLFLSSFMPVKVLKGSTETGKNKGTFRNLLVISQFASAVILMIATVFVIRQLKYIQAKDPGYNREQVINITLDRLAAKNYEVLKQQLLGNSLVTGVTGAQDVLGSHLDQSGVDFVYNNEPKRDLVTTHMVVDHDFLKLYKMKVIAGRDFSDGKIGYGREYIVNESLAHELLKDKKNASMSSLIGQRFGFDSLGTITGIVKDFNFNSLHYKIETMFLFNQANWGFNQMSVKINGNKAAEAVSLIQSLWKKINPGNPLEYQFLDDHFAEVYRADSQVSQIVSILAGLAIFVSCLGLFGLASYSAEKRVKEIGVRKVLGASVQNIVMLLSTHFLKLVLIANLIAWPIAWYAVHQWLADYAYRININWIVFAIIAAVSILIALLTVSFQSVKAALANPVKSLRSE